VPSPAAHPGVGASLTAARKPPHRTGDMRDTMAELTERAQVISQEAGTKVAAAMRDVISAGAGIAGFAIESARDLVQFMVRRGQMTQDEADRLIREAEEAHAKRPSSERGRPTATKIAAEKAAKVKAETAARNAAAALAYQHEMRTRRLESVARAKAAANAEKSGKPTKAPAKPAPAVKAAAKSTPAKKTAAKQAPAKNTPAKKAPAKAANRAAAPKKPVAKKKR
jgi:polyhydroxyalkanoate synthesis regulator phasin